MVLGVSVLRRARRARDEPRRCCWCCRALRRPDNGSFAVLLTDLFPTRIRFTGVALVFNVSFTVFSGTAPLAASTLIGYTGSVVSPAYLMIGARFSRCSAAYG